MTISFFLFLINGLDVALEHLTIILFPILFFFILVTYVMKTLKKNNDSCEIYVKVVLVIFGIITTMYTFEKVGGLTL